MTWPRGIGKQEVQALIGAIASVPDHAHAGVAGDGGAIAYSALTGKPALAFSGYILIQDQKAQNTAGGTFTSGAWRTHVLNTEVADTGNHATLASNQITLLAGTYEVDAWALARAVDGHQLKLYNVSDTADLVIGGVTTAENLSSTAHLTGRFTLAATKVIELQHQCTTTKADTGFGVANNYTTEIFASVRLLREA